MKKVLSLQIDAAFVLESGLMKWTSKGNGTEELQYDNTKGYPCNLSKYEFPSTQAIS